MLIKHCGVQDYKKVWEEMKKFTQDRVGDTYPNRYDDELWLVQHPPVYTQGQAGKPEHVLIRNEIPIIQTDRGGQITYHGPGQLVAYVLVELKKYGLGVRDFVCLQERAIIELLKKYDIEAIASREAPGVYVNGKKIASIGLRIKQGCSYHGLALNVDMDLSPFTAIRPCGLFEMQMTQMKDFIPNINFDIVEKELAEILVKNFTKEQAQTCALL